MKNQSAPIDELHEISAAISILQRRLTRWQSRLRLVLEQADPEGATSTEETITRLLKSWDRYVRDFQSGQLTATDFDMARLRLIRELSMQFKVGKRESAARHGRPRTEQDELAPLVPPTSGGVSSE